MQQEHATQHQQKCWKKCLFPGKLANFPIICYVQKDKISLQKPKFPMNLISCWREDVKTNHGPVCNLLGKSHLKYAYLKNESDREFELNYWKSNPILSEVNPTFHFSYPNVITFKHIIQYNVMPNFLYKSDEFIFIVMRSSLRRREVTNSFAVVIPLTPVSPHFRHIHLISMLCPISYGNIKIWPSVFNFNQQMSTCTSLHVHHSCICQANHITNDYSFNPSTLQFFIPLPTFLIIGLSKCYTK